MIRTKRTIIRPIKIEDEPDLYEVYSDPQIFTHFGKGVYSREQHIDSIKRAVAKWEDKKRGDLVASYKGKVIARLIIFPNKKGDYEVGYVINANYWGKGLGREIAQGLITYAFEEKNAEKVVACIRESNLRSIAIVEALGFEETHRVIGTDGINRIWFVVIPASFKKLNV